MKKIILSLVVLFLVASCGGTPVQDIKNMSYHEKGKMYADKGKYDKAIENFNKEIEIHPDNGFAYYGRGASYKGKGLLAEAIEDYTKAISLRPKHAMSHMERGFCYSLLDEYDKAIEDFTKVMISDPKYPNSYNLRGSAYASLGEYNKALEDYKKGCDLEKDTYMNGSSCGYIKYLSEMQKVSGNDTLALSNRGGFFYSRKKYDKAIEDYNKVLTIHPRNADSDSSIYLYRGKAYFSKGENAQAIEDFNKACELGNKEGCNGKQVLEKAIPLLKKYHLQVIDHAVSDEEKKDVRNKLTPLLDFTMPWNVNQNTDEAWKILAASPGYADVVKKAEDAITLITEIVVTDRDIGVFKFIIIGKIRNGKSIKYISDWIDSHIKNDILYKMATEK